MNKAKTENRRNISPKVIVIKNQILNLEADVNKFFSSGAVNKKQVDTIIDKIKSDLDSMSELGETESLRLQMAMDRLSKMMSTLSNILKKISDTANSITQNLK